MSVAAAMAGTIADVEHRYFLAAALAKQFGSAKIITIEDAAGAKTTWNFHGATETEMRDLVVAALSDHQEALMKMRAATQVPSG